MQGAWLQSPPLRLQIFRTKKLFTAQRYTEACIQQSYPGTSVLLALFFCNAVQDLTNEVQSHVTQKIGQISKIRPEQIQALFSMSKNQPAS